MNNPFELEACILHHIITSRHNPPVRVLSGAPRTLPQREIFASLSSGTSGGEGAPELAECAVHLELLEAFLVLKRRVLKSNALDYSFGTRRVRGQARSDPAWLRKREGKWDKFLDLAVLRFEVWWEEMAGEIGKGAFDARKHLPPLDVLMVWHTYMLDPGLYAADVKQKLAAQGERSLHKCAKFPWKAIHMAVNHETRAYTMTAEQELEWEKIASMPGSLFDFLSNYEAMKDETLGILAAGDLPPRGLNWLFESYSRVDYVPSLSIDLKSAVQRQGLFVEKMGNFLWIRSPYLAGTLSRALTRYMRFTELLKLRHKPKRAQWQVNFDTAPHPPVIPAIDIDLVWHTHQLDPPAYHSWCMEKVGKFVDHNDTLDGAVLARGWEVTKKVYWKKYGVPYGACFCWFCEGVKSKSEKLAAADTQGMTEADWEKLGKEINQEVQYWRSKERARRA